MLLPSLRPSDGQLSRDLQTVDSPPTHSLGWRPTPVLWLPTVVLVASLASGCTLVGETAGDHPDQTASSTMNLVMVAQPDGWDAVLPWRGAVADAYARVNAIAASHEFRRRLMQAGPPNGRPAYHRMFGDRLNRNEPLRVRFQPKVGQGPPVMADCYGTVWLQFPKVLGLSVETLTGELAEVVAMSSLRPNARCRGEILRVVGADEAMVKLAGTTAQQLATTAFPGGHRTVAQASGWTVGAPRNEPVPGSAAPGAPATRRPSQALPAAPLTRDDSAANPPGSPALPSTGQQTSEVGTTVIKNRNHGQPLTIMTSYGSTRRGQALLKVNARPWARCIVGRHAAKTTPLSVTVNAGEHQITCTKGQERQVRTIFIPRRPLDRLARGRLIVTTDGAERCYVDGIQYPGAGATVDVAPGVRRVECVYEGNTVTRGVRVLADRVIPVHFDVRQRRLYRAGRAPLVLKAKPWARCSVDGGAAQVTPMTVWVKPGRHRIDCKRNDRTLTKRVQVSSRRRTALTLDMADAKPAKATTPSPANLKITVAPWGVCWVDGRAMGVAMIETPVAPGMRRVTCEHRGKRSTKLVSVVAGTTEHVHFKF